MSASDRRPDAPPARAHSFAASLTHLDAHGQLSMVDVSEKPATVRVARARARLVAEPGVVEAIFGGALQKGEALAAARLAGILAAKRTGELIPLCHPLALSHVEIRFRPGAGGIEIEAEARCTGPTGVEMEAMTAAAVAGLTLYDMAKALDRTMTLEAVRLVEKRGGKSGVWQREGEPDAAERLGGAPAGASSAAAPPPEREPGG